MKKSLMSLIALFAIMVFAAPLTSCSDDDDDSEKSELATKIIGKWRIVMVEQNDGTMFDVTSSIAEKVFEPTYATFKSNGEYYGTGYFGTGYGEYKVKGNRIYTYINGNPFFIYTAENFSATRATLVMSMNGSIKTLRVVVQKQ